MGSLQEAGQPSGEASLSGVGGRAATGRRLRGSGGSSSSGSAQRVLVVDDDTAVAEGLRMLLKQDYAVEVAHSGEQALGILCERLGDFDVVLCDLMMPGMSGAELYARLGETVAACQGRLIFMTGGAFTPDAERFLEEIPNLRLEKPFDVETIERVLRLALAQRMRGVG